MYVTVALCAACVDTVTHPQAGQIFRMDPLAPEFYAVADALRVQDVWALINAMAAGEQVTVPLWVGNGCYRLAMRAERGGQDGPTCGSGWHPVDGWS